MKGMTILVFHLAAERTLHFLGRSFNPARLLTVVGLVAIAAATSLLFPG